MRDLEDRYSNELVGIGVHSGKFISERVTEDIRKACQRLGVDHPVVNDRQFRVWRQYAVRAWPTLAVVDPTGRLVFSQAGELTADALAPIIEKLIAEAEGQGVLDRAPFALGQAERQRSSGPLRFPGRVLAAGDRLFISDTGHHKILEAELSSDGLSGRIRRIIGGAAGFSDGSLADAQFREPQGLALHGETLFVADRSNHAIRAVDLASEVVTTLAGTGELGRGGGGPALRSPWDVLIHKETLFIAMAGSHQIWALDLTSRGLRPYAGSGYEDISDGPLGAATLAQPSGLTTDGHGRLYFADSESSGVRWADLDPNGSVGTLVGTGLFEFGDQDGVGEEVRLQHPLDVAWHDGALVVADTYNHKLKRIDPVTRACTTWLGTGEPGQADGDERQFDEPGGLSVADTCLYVADTNSHRVRVADLRTGRVETLALTD